MIGNSDTVIIETESTHSLVLSTLSKYVTLNSQKTQIELRPVRNKENSKKILTNISQWGSDHVTYLKRGIPAALIANDHSVYKYYHTQYDTIENVKVDVGLKTVKACAESIVSLIKTIKI